MSSTAPGRALAPRSQKKLVLFLLFFLVTAFVTYGKNREILNPASEIARHFAPAKIFVALHAFFGVLAMTLGAFQFSNRLRARYLNVHRVLGYVYVVSVFLAGPLALPIAARIGSPSLVAATVAQSLGWMVTTGIALYCIRSGNVAQHRRWMIRGYPFAMVFTVARMIIPLPPVMRTGLLGVEIVVWSTIAAAAFLPNIFLEWRAISPKPKPTTA